MQGKTGKTEKILLAASAAFLCLLTVLLFRDRPPSDAGCTVETQFAATASEIVPVDSSADTFTAAGKLNLNTATAAELEELPGVGEKLAQRIVDYRTANGDFRTIEELKNVKGIGDGKFSAVADQITVEEETP